MEDVAVSGSFWKKRRVLVTGHTGFKGSWLSLWLQLLGADVIGLSIGVPTSPSLFERADVQSGMRSLVGDVCDRGALTDVVGEVAPELVIHLAAQAVVLQGYENPVQTFETNVMGTVNLLEALRGQPTVRAALVVTSDKCYRPSVSSAPYSEDDALGGSDPYSSSKACAELVTEAYRSSYFSGSTLPSVAVATARAGNVIGGGDWTPYRIIPDLVRAFESNQSASVRNPTHVRPWQHVLDPLAGYLMLCERLFESGLGFAEAWNFGPPPSGPEVTVASLVEKAAAVWGHGASWRLAEVSESSVDTAPATVQEREALRLDPAKAMRRLGWAARLDLESSVRWTIEWHQRVRAGEDPRRVTVRQIEAYIA